MHTDTQSSALLAHVISQTKANLEFLVSQNYISNADASGIISRLSAIDTTASASDVSSITDRTRHLNMNTNNERERASSPPRAVMPTKRPVPPPLAPRVQQAKAIWDYNVGGSEPNDLSFHAGDIIDIISETNADWWTGKVSGRQGLFPSNYVEKLASRAPSPSNARPIPVPAPPHRTEPSYSRAPSYSTPPPPFPNHNAYSSPPPPQHWQPPHGGPPPQPYGGYHQPPPIMNEKQQQQVVYAQPPPPQVQIQAPPPQEPKKSKFGGLGNTLATSAVGGVGFGAGAAIGGGIIDAIF